MPDRIVEEELALLAQVRERLTQTASPHAPSEDSLVKELEHLRSANAAASAGCSLSFVTGAGASSRASRGSFGKRRRRCSAAQSPKVRTETRCTPSAGSTCPT